MKNSSIQFPSTKTVISTAASVAATAMLLRSFARDFVPSELRHYFLTKAQRILTTFTNEITIIIDEYEGLNKNKLFYAAEIYLATLNSPSTKIFRASLPEKEKKIHVSMGGNEELTDIFRGLKLKWRTVRKQTQARYVPSPDEYHSTAVTEIRYLELSFHKKYKSKILDEYLPYVLERSVSIKDEKKTLKLHTLKNERVHGPGRNPWQSVNLDHPANFETLAMDEEMKRMVVGDLDRFLKRKDLYRKVGKAWKRGYLLFGPPGTGKSSLIAAMANYLNFDVYDLELTDIRANSELRRLLIWTANRSILVVEDIDASIDLSERKTGDAKKAPPPPYNPSFYNQGPKVTLSGLLNFIDGLWSSCGDERIIIFTTNHIDKLDPALLRPGRMDVHIHMSYCTPSGLKILASNYLGINDHHPLLSEAEGMIASKKVTPAEVGEQLLKSDDPETALQGLIEFLERKKECERDAEENQEKVEIKEEELEKTDDVRTGDGLKELIKLSKDCISEEGRGRIVKKDEAANALRILIDFLDPETGKGNVKCEEENLGSEKEVVDQQETKIE